MKDILNSFESLPLIAKVVLLIVLGYIISPVYRIIRYLETKNTMTLIIGVLGLITGVGNVILQVLDIITEVTKGKITVFAN